MQSQSTLPPGVSTRRARWPMANDGSVPMPHSPGPSASNRLRRPSARRSASRVQRWPSQPTYCRSSSQIGQWTGGPSDDPDAGSAAGCSTPQVTQIQPGPSIVRA